MTLEQVNDALARNDLPAALDHALAVWKEQRCDALAEIVIMLYERLPQRNVARSTYNGPFREIEEVGDPHDLPRQFAYILASSQSWTWASRCISMLVRRPANPYLARGLATLAVIRMPWSSPEHDPHASVILAIGEAGRNADAAALMSCASKIDTPSHSLREALAHAIARIQNRPQPVLDLSATYAALAQQAEYQTRHTARTKELLASVYANLDDDAPRLVLADHFAEAGDPRGELIALQCRSNPTAEQNARALELVEQHGLAWLYELGDDLISKEGLVYERGFVARVRLDLGASRPEIIGHHLWTTLRELELVKGTLASFLDPVCVSLRSLVNINSVDLEDICRIGRTLPLERLHFEWFDDRCVDSFVRALPYIPDVRDVHLGAASLDDAQELVEHVPLDRVRVHHEPSADWYALLGANLRELVFDTPNGQYRIDRDHRELRELA